MSTTSVIPLLSSWEQYTVLYPSGDLHGFAHWLLSRPNPANPANPRNPINLTDPIGLTVSPAHPPAQSGIPSATSEPVPIVTTTPSAAGLDATAQSTLLITRLFRILQFLSKPDIKRLGFKDMEFGVLVQITLMDRPNKKELCKEMLIENSTGVEITKRLAKKGFLREETDPDDRRSARLSITEKGKRLLLQGYEKLAAIHQDFLEDFTEEEKQQLVRLLSKINQYHTPRLNTQKID